jgi:hypothetical protein
MTIRIGRPPRLSRRQRLARIANQGARYLAAYALIGCACYGIADVHLFVPGLALAAMLANPWRPKRAVRPAQRGGLRAADDSVPRWGSRPGLPPGPFPRTT